MINLSPKKETDDLLDTELFSEGDIIDETIGIAKDVAKQATGLDIDKVKKDIDGIVSGKDPNDTGKDPDYEPRNRVQQTNDMLAKDIFAPMAEPLNKIWGKAASQYVDGRSIIARARNSVLQFPIYVTQTVRVNEAQIIARLFEHVYTSMVQTVLSQNPILDEKEANGLVFLQRYHSNLTESATVRLHELYADLYNEFYEPIDELDAILKESVYHKIPISENCVAEFRVTGDDRLITMENARLMNEPLTGFRYLKEDTTDTSEDTVKDQSSQDTFRSHEMTTEEFEQLAFDDIDLGNAGIRIYKTGGKNLSGADLAAYKNIAHNVDDAIDRIKKMIRNKQMGNSYSYIDGKYYCTANIESKQSTSDKTSTRTVTKGKEPEKPEFVPAVSTPQILRDTDIKKINDMKPYNIEAMFHIKDANQNIVRDVRFIVGVKTVMHLVRSQDLQDDLQELVTGKIKSLQKVRYKTGEIKFRDYLFNLKGLKADASKHINYNKRWIANLKRLAEYRQQNGTFFSAPIKALTKGNIPYPNATLILAQTDVTALTNSTGIDLSVISNANKLARNLFLLAIAIVDSSAGTMRTYFPDMDNDWGVHSLSSIDAELAKTDNSKIMAEINRLVNR